MTLTSNPPRPLTDEIGALLFQDPAARRAGVLPEVDLARRIAGPDATPDDFVKAMTFVHDVIDEGRAVLREELRHRGLTYAELRETLRP